MGDVVDDHHFLEGVHAGQLGRLDDHAVGGAPGRDAGRNRHHRQHAERLDPLDRHWKVQRLEDLRHAVLVGDDDVQREVAEDGALQVLGVPAAQAR